MNRMPSRLASAWTLLSPRLLPFADAATTELPLARLVRLGMFQLSVGMTTTLVTGTLNRVMIVELAVPASLVAIMVSLPLVAAPFRALVGFKSDHHASVLGWRRVPFIWFGTLLQFGGLAIMPFALILLSGDTNGTREAALGITALAFLLVGAGTHTTQTAGLALATDLAPELARPRVIAFLYLVLLVGMVASALVFGALLDAFSQIRLIQVVQGAAVAAMVLNGIALWKQEPRRPRSQAAAVAAPRPRFGDAWRAFVAGGRAVRLLCGVALGAAAFGMQDVLLEPYGGQVLGLAVAETTALTGLAAAGAIVAFGVAAYTLVRGVDPTRLAAMGALAGIMAFAAVIFASPLAWPALFRGGTVLMGFGSGLFGVGTLSAAMTLRDAREHGLALGAWGAVHATSTGIALAVGGAVRDATAAITATGALGDAMRGISVPYSVVYHLEIALLFAALVALGPLVAPQTRTARHGGQRLGLAELPG